MTKEELAAKYHWRIKYPKTYQMALRNKFLTGELPPEFCAPEAAAQRDTGALDFLAARQKRHGDSLRSEAEAPTKQSAPQVKNPRRRGHSRHRKLAGRGTGSGELAINACLEEILDRLDRIETALADLETCLET